jgi:tetratricopeptide (TPR) repeat protein
MKRSENQNYRDYMDRYAHDDYRAAREALDRCIADLRREAVPEAAQESDFIRRMGDLFFLESDLPEALRLYQLSEQADPTSLLAKYFFAKFLGEKAGDVRAAIAKCDQIIRLALQQPTPASDDDLGTDAYIAKAQELKRALLEPTP